MWGGCSPEGRIHERKWWCYAPVPLGTFSGACSNCRCSLLISLRTRQCMPLTEQLERRGGLFLDSASTLFFGGERSGSGELPEDNSLSAVASLSPGKMGSLPLFCLTGGAGWLLSRAFSPRSSSKRARRQSFSYCIWLARFCNSSICLACSSCFVSFDHPKDGYVRDSWEDVFSSCERSVRKLLVDHLLRDGSRLGEDVPGQ